MSLAEKLEFLGILYYGRRILHLFKNSCYRRKGKILYNLRHQSRHGFIPWYRLWSKYMILNMTNQRHEADNPFPCALNKWGEKRGGSIQGESEAKQFWKMLTLRHTLLFFFFFHWYQFERKPGCLPVVFGIAISSSRNGEICLRITTG